MATRLDDERRVDAVDRRDRGRSQRLFRHRVSAPAAYRDPWDLLAVSRIGGSDHRRPSHLRSFLARVPGCRGEIVAAAAGTSVRADWRGDPYRISGSRHGTRAFLARDWLRRG